MRAIDADALEPDADYYEGDYWAVSIVQIHNAPTIEPQRKKGKWIPQNLNKSDGMISTVVYYYPKCSVCGASANYTNFCPNCGADMRTPVEVARDIVHEAINNSVWSDTVDTAKMRKVVDDKYAEIRGDANVDANT